MISDQPLGVHLTLFDHYQAYHYRYGDFVYLDIAEMPMGIFGSILVRTMELYSKRNMDYLDHFELKRDGNNFRVLLLFKDKEV